MKIYQYTDDDVQDTATRGMWTGIQQLVTDGLLTKQQGEEFIKSHAIALLTDDNFLSSFRKFFKKEVEKDTTFFICIKLNIPKEPE